MTLLILCGLREWNTRQLDFDEKWKVVDKLCVAGDSMKILSLTGWGQRMGYLERIICSGVSPTQRFLKTFIFFDCYSKLFTIWPQRIFQALHPSTWPYPLLSLNKTPELPCAFLLHAFPQTISSAWNTILSPAAWQNLIHSSRPSSTVTSSLTIRAWYQLFLFKVTPRILPLKHSFNIYYMLP